MLCHLMMLYEVYDVEVARTGRFRFELQGRVVEYGEIEFCLISGLRFGPYVDIINTKVNRSSTLRNQLFPNVRDEDLRLKNLEDYVKEPAFLMCSDEDAVMVMQMIFLLRGLIGQDDNTCILSAVHELADSQYNWNIYLRDNEDEGYTKTMKYTVLGFQFPFKVWILETFHEALRFAHHEKNEFPRMRAWRIKTQLILEQCLCMLDVSVDNNIPRDFEPTPVEISFPFFERYVNWTLDKVQSPPQQQSPPKERSPSPQLMSPPMQRSPSPWNQFQGADYTSASHF
ncbi:unnamed protein product [Lactuca saligna]|uniref:Uncharacterized protein n=1 Tax=Lactuca saligna TaxID=75948 RepID=A0AA35ZQM7_LACSI|nr:unnamed protein product [Lactuca saligna]